MLAKANRLPRRDFNRYFGSGRRAHSPYLTLVYTPDIVLRASVVVGKKVAKLAHERNLIKRRLYAQIAKELRLTGLAGTLILVVKPPLAKLTRKEQALTLPAALGLLQKGR